MEYCGRRPLWRRGTRILNEFQNLEIACSKCKFLRNGTQIVKTRPCSAIFFSIAIEPEFSTFLLISQKLIKIYIPNFINIFGHHVKHRKREPEGVHGQLEGFNRNLRPQAAVANNNNLAPNFSSGQESESVRVREVFYCGVQ